MAENENDPNEVLAMQTAEHIDAMHHEIETLRAALARKSAEVATHPSNREMPRYYLNEPVYFEDAFFPKGCTIEWDDVPNREMVALNEPAKARMQEFLQHLELGARQVAAQRGRNFYGLVMDRNQLLDTYREDVQNEVHSSAPVFQMPVRKDEVPAMPTTDAAIAARRRAPQAGSKVGKVEGPAPIKPPQGPMAPAIVGRGAA